MFSEFLLSDGKQRVHSPSGVSPSAKSGTPTDSRQTQYFTVRIKKLSQTFLPTLYFNDSFIPDVHLGSIYCLSPLYRGQSCTWRHSTLALSVYLSTSEGRPVIGWHRPSKLDLWQFSISKLFSPLLSSPCSSKLCSLRECGVWKRYNSHSNIRTYQSSDLRSRFEINTKNHFL